MNQAKLKNLIYAIITQTDETDVNGKPIPRQSYSKKFFNVLRLKKEIESHFRYFQDGGSEPLSVDKINPEKPILMTVITDEPIDFAPYLEGIKYYYDQLSEIPSSDIDAVEDFLKLIGNETNS